MPAVVHVIPIVLIDNIHVIGLVPVVCPVVRPGINQTEPKAAILKTRESANHHIRLVVDDERVVRTKVAVVTILRDAVAVVTAALLPRAVVRIPIMRAMLLPCCLLGMLLFLTVVGLLVVLLISLLLALGLLVVLLRLLLVLLLLLLLVLLLGLLFVLLLFLLVLLLFLLVLLLRLLVVLLRLLLLRLLLVLLLLLLLLVLLLGLLFVLLLFLLVLLLRVLLLLRLLLVLLRLGMLLLWLGMLLRRLLSVLLWLFLFFLFLLCERRSHRCERHKQNCRSESCKYFHWNCLNYRLGAGAANRCILLTASGCAHIGPPWHNPDGERTSSALPLRVWHLSFEKREPNAPEPIRAGPFSGKRIEQHAESLAAQTMAPNVLLVDDGEEHHVRIATG